MDYPYDLGRWRFGATAANDAARTWVDRGLVWTMGYNFEAAVDCFRRAAAADPGCAMAHWGVAYASGPDYNMPWGVMGAAGAARALATAHAATETALACRDGATPAERALIDALPARYPQAVPDPRLMPDLQPWTDAFADAMRAAHRAHPRDLTVRAIFVEALMNRTPWRMWDTATGAPAEGASTVEAQQVLEHAFAADGAAWDHPGLLHLYVHLMEMSPVPERALRHGDRLRDLVPDAGHLVHMGTHIDVQVGDYAAALRWNEAAMAANDRWFAREGAMNLYTGYRAHDAHFAIYAAMFLGRLPPALEALDHLDRTVPEDLLRIEDPPMADYYEAYLAFRPHVLVRFGLWDEVLGLDLPQDRDLRCTLTAHTLYARCVALAATGDVAGAEAAETQFLDAADRVPETRLLHTNRVVDILKVARHMARGEILYRKKDFDAAFKVLRQAVVADDALAYDEPWGWMQPTRHALGALLLKQGRVGEAEMMFREDLGLGRAGVPRAQVHPDNVWALRGLVDCLTARGEAAELPGLRRRLAVAEARADRPVTAACACAGR